MATLSVSVALLFFFFAFLSPSVALARIQISKPKYDIIVRQLTNPLPRSDVKASLRLPSHSNKVKIHPLEPRRPELEVRSDQKTRPIQKLQDSNAQKARQIEKLQDSNARPFEKLQDSNAQRARPIEKLQDSNAQKARLFEKLQDSNAQKARPFEKLQDSNAQKARPIEKLPDPNGQKAQLINRRAESVEKKTKKPIVRLPYLALPDLIAVKNQSDLPIEKNNEESKIFEDLDLIMKAQPESNEEENSKSKPIENQPESEEAQPETKAATVEALPLKEVNFRLRSRLPYRLCRHSHLHHIEENLPIPSRSSQVEIPYGNDMIYTFGENGDFDPEVFPGSFNHVPPKMFPFLHRQHDVNVEEVSKHLPKTAQEKVSKHLPKTAQEKVSYFLVENDSEKVENDHSSSTVRHRVLPKTIPFLHRNGPHHLRRQDAIQKVSNHRLPENNHGKDSNHRLTTENNNHGGSVSHIPRKWIAFLHQHDLNREKKPEKKESTLRKRIRKFLGQYLD